MELRCGRVLCGICRTRIVRIEHRLGPAGEPAYAHVAHGIQDHDATPRSPPFLR